MDKTACGNTDPIRISHFIASISNIPLADKIAKQVQHDLTMQQDAFKKALTLEAALQLAEDVHLGRPHQIMQIIAVALRQ